MCNLKVAVVGLGFVGGSMYESFNLKGMKKNIDLFCYDKFKNGGIGNLKDCLNANIIFLALPTKYNNILGEYDKKNIFEICDLLSEYKYKGVIVLKSTIEPETTDKLSSQLLSRLLANFSHTTNEIKDG